MTTSPITSITDELLAELEAAAKVSEGWKLEHAFQVVEEGYSPDEWEWHVGAIDEDGNQYPVLLVGTGQYDHPEQAEGLALYYAAVSPATILALVARLNVSEAKSDLLQVERDRYRDMAGCMDLLRRDLIDAGVVGDACPPMFMTEGVMGYIGKIKAELSAVEAERAELKKDADKFREIVAAIAREKPRRTSHRGNAPGHGHDVAGIWDSDNGELAGTECAWCKTWALATEAAMQEPKP